MAEPTGRSAEEATQQALDELTLSIDGPETGVLPNGLLHNGVNGKGRSPSSPSPRSSGEHTGLDRASILQRELDKCRKEKDELQAQYQLLLSRTSNLKNSIQNKIRQDAVRLFTSSLQRSIDINFAYPGRAGQALRSDVTGDAFR